MLYKKGTILKYESNHGWFLVDVLGDKGEGVVIKTNHPARRVGDGGKWSFYPHGEDVGRWSIHKESNILRLLEKVDAL